ncbi:MAG TPA: sensor histidine kinase [Anaerolineaceae bacterium]|jgi:NarL family two-component system sensor histidine kinase YdfH|nr:sensor histidine kinase [Anaerolineaceae bacterium]
MKTRAPIINTERETRIFFWFMTVVLVAMSLWLIVTQFDRQQPWRLGVFVVLMSAHITLHWILRIFAERPGWLIRYMLLQGGLAIALVYLSKDIGIAFAVSMALVGEAVGVYGVTRRGFLAMAYYLILSLGFYIWVSGTAQIGWWLLGALPMVIFVVIYVEMYTRQSNANERAQTLLNELETANRQLTNYAEQVEDLTIAAERQRMARELHDTLSQGLAGLILQLEAANAHLESGRGEKAHQIIQNTMERARTTLAEARRAIDDLRGPAAPACTDILQDEVTHFSASTGIPCTLEIDIPRALPASLCDTLQRILAEGLANIAQHARATQSQVIVTAQNGTLQLQIHDNGQGFDPQTVPAGHYGLIGIRERIELTGGTLEIESGPGQGTQIIARIPIP